MIDPLIDIANPDTLRLTIRFTQYLRPDGRTRTVEFVVIGDMATKAEKLLKLGWRFEAEMLTTGEVSLTVEDDEDECRAIEIVPNGPEVPKAVDRLVNRAAEAAKEKS